MHCGLDRSQGRRKNCLDEQRVLATIKRARVWLQCQGHGLLITRCTVWGLSQAFLRTKRNVWQKLLHEVHHVFSLFSGNHFPSFFRNKVWLPCLKTRLLMSQPSFPPCKVAWRFSYFELEKSKQRVLLVIIQNGIERKSLKWCYYYRWEHNGRGEKNLPVGFVPFTKTVPIKWYIYLLEITFLSVRASCSQLIDFEFTFIVLYFTAIKSFLTIF